MALTALARDLAAHAVAATRASRDRINRFEVGEFHAVHGDREGLAILDTERTETMPFELAQVAELYGRVGDRATVERLHRRVGPGLVRSSADHRREAWTQLARAYEWLGDERAADDLLAREAPGDGDARAALGEIAVRAGRSARAHAIAEALEPRPAAMIYETMLAHHRTRGEHREAAAALDRLIGFGLPGAGTIARYGLVALRLGDELGALRLARQASADDRSAPPYVHEWCLQLAEIYRAVGSPAERKLAAVIWKSVEDAGLRDGGAVELAKLAQNRQTYGYPAESQAWIARTLAALAAGDDRAGWARHLLIKIYLVLDDVAAAIEQASRIAADDERVASLLLIAEHCARRGTVRDPAIAAALGRLA